jgi:alpha-glucosidase
VLEIEFIEQVGWCFELRYDLLEGKGRRQPFTGKQESLRRAGLDLEQGAGAELLLRAGEQIVAINLASGALGCSFEGKDYWSCPSSPFARHDRPVEILEEIQSLEQIDWNEPTPWRSTPKRFETEMVRFSYTAQEGPILGLPGQTGEFNRKGQRFNLYNTDQPFHLPSRLPMYQSWPILIHQASSGAGWVGIFHDNPARTYVDLGDHYRDTVLFESITNNTRVYLLQGTTIGEITNKFVRLLGNSVFPPAWAFGYQQCRYSYMSTAEVRKVAKSFRDHKIPCDSIYFDIDYMDGFRVFTKNEERFADLRECLNDLKDEGFKAVCIVDPGVKVDQGYHVYEELKESDALITDQAGEPFEIVCWPGKAVLPDFFSSKAREQWAEIQRKWLKDYPFSGIWNDMNEPSNFDGGNDNTSLALSAEGPLSEIFNLYGYSMAQASALGWQKANPAERGVVITRSGYPGVQQNAVIWHGDNYTWWEHIRLAIDTCISYSICGAFYSGPDVPGFFGNSSDDMAVRFYQVAAFFPLFRGHSYKLNSSKEPYAYGKRAIELIRKAIQLRYSLLTEWYSKYERCLRLGTPPMLPVLTADGSALRDAFLLFDTFLVAGVTNRDEQMKAIWLPEGQWYRLGETKTVLDGGRWILEPLTMEQIPVFVKAGSIVARNTVGKNVAETLSGPISYEIYRDSSGAATGYLYQDDGLANEDPSAQTWRLSIAAGESEIKLMSCVSSA